MRVWNIVDDAKRKRPFEPVAAEIFAVRGRTKERLFTAIAPDRTILESGRACQYCAFKREEDRSPLCSVLPIVCKANVRRDKRQVIFIERDAPK